MQSITCLWLLTTSRIRLPCLFDLDPLPYARTVTRRPREPVAGRFIVIGRREWGGEVVAHKIIPDEECVDPGETATNEGIALSPSQYFKRSERRTKIIRT